MVMTPGPWGEALDELLEDDRGSAPVLVVPTPAGERFTQRTAEQLAGEDRLILACGRYEGIDQRFVDHARSRIEVRELSVGDYVLNGGEAAALVVTEAVVRLLPGFMGNAGSLAEESHGTRGLLESPVYTKPPTWRGLDVPDVLLGGDHAHIASWRHAESLRRTAERRPDLLAVSQTVALDGTDELAPRLATLADAGELMTLTRACLGVPAEEDLPAVRRGIDVWHSYLLRADGRLVGSVRMRHDGTTWYVGRLMVAPDLRGRGLGRFLLSFAETRAPDDITRFELATEGLGTTSLFRRAGYRPSNGALSKPRRR
jgi:tRNA (guanine37-N1)-methyltransferase